MAVPTFVGHSASGAHGTGAATPALPEGSPTTGDLLILHIEGNGEDANPDNPPTGGEWTAVGPGSVASATGGASDDTRCSVYWAPYDPDINRTVPDAGNHIICRLYAFRGVDLTDPFVDTDSGSNAVASTSHSAATTIDTTGVADTLVCLAGSHGDLSVGAANPANTSLTDVAIDSESTTNQGNDGSIVLITGTKATGGAGGTFTWTTNQSEGNAWIAFALRPEGAVAPPSGGSETTVTVSTSGGGVKHASGGSQATVTAASAGAGTKASTGASEATVLVTSDGAGSKTTSSGSGANVTVDSQGAGSKAASSGSEATVTVTATGGGTRARSGGSTASVTVDATGAGTKATGEGSEATVTALVDGDGSKATTGGSETTVTVTSSGGGFEGEQLFDPHQTVTGSLGDSASGAVGPQTAVGSLVQTVAGTTRQTVEGANEPQP